jgi:Animal haem peroxidase
MSGNFGHGQVGSREQQFSSLLPLRAIGYDTGLLFDLSNAMASDLDQIKDGADPEENLLVPAGYTYFGQFIDHDLTFDTTSTLNPADSKDGKRQPSNLRTPRFDLDSLYGDGPDSQPFMYADDGASLLLNEKDDPRASTTFEQADIDLLRNSKNGRAIIGDKRNDENSIVCQIHLAFVKYHNAVVAKLKEKGLSGSKLFEQARNEIRWSYQLLVINDFLPRIVQNRVLNDLKDKTPNERKNSYALYTPDKRENLPREFVAAAYRFGHSAVRFGYRLNSTTRLDIFKPSGEDPNATVTASKDESTLLGFDPLPKSHVIDYWARFFPNDKNPATSLGDGPKGVDGSDPDPTVRLQFAYKIDPSLVDPLTVLPSKISGDAAGQAIEAIKPKKLQTDRQDRPSLALLNLLRGNSYLIQGGQAIAKVLQEKGFPVEPLEAKYLVTRNSAGDNIFKFNPIESTLQKDTPLWFYILAEAQQNIVDKVELSGDGTFSEDQLKDPCIAKTQLGWVGGRIVAEVFYGLLDSDPDSVFNAAPENWQPMIGNINEIVVADLLKFAGEQFAPGS